MAFTLPEDESNSPEPAITGATPPEVHGYLAPGFERVGDEFQRNFAERDEIGASFAAYLDGELVVDLWGGIANRATGRDFDRDTLQVIFSGSKGLVAVCLLLLIERGQLDLDNPVATYWPEFAANGKEKITVRQLVSHTAGLPGFVVPLDVADLTDFDRLAAALAAQRTLLEPGTLCYHTISFGWLCGELIHRVDGRRIGQFFAEEVAEPLGLEIWFGLPEELEQRVATLELDAGWGEADPGTTPSELLTIVDGNPDVWSRGSFPWNSRAFHAAEIPGAGAVAATRSVARLYGCLARGGELDGVRLLSARTIEQGRHALSGGVEVLGGTERSFGTGFLLQDATRSLGPPPDAFGHSGAGGSMHGGWPSERVGFSYAMNLMSSDPNDARSRSLLSALNDCVTAQ